MTKRLIGELLGCIKADGSVEVVYFIERKVEVADFTDIRYIYAPA